MNISNDGSGGVDYVTYFTKQFPKDLAAMASLRDELEARQGALTAVNDANQLRKDAEEVKAKAIAEAESSTAAAKQYLADAKAKNDDVNARIADLTTNETALARAKADYEANRAVDEKSLAERIKAVSVRETQANAREDALAKTAAELKTQQDSLDARIKAFQAKVAALSA